MTHPHKLKLKVSERKLLEKLADLEHQQWSHWTHYLLSRLSLSPNKLQVDKKTKEDFQRWVRQIITPYKDLSQKEKEADRIWARKVLELIKSENSWEDFGKLGFFGGSVFILFECVNDLYGER